VSANTQRHRMNAQERGGFLDCQNVRFHRMPTVRVSRKSDRGGDHAQTGPARHVE
jgi:hypothetical protein